MVRAKVCDLLDEERMQSDGHELGAWRPLVYKGRGAVSNRVGRFEAFQRAEFDDGWVDDDDDAPAPLRTEVREEFAKSIITRNRSPDIFFDRSLNPYRGCEHGCIYCYARPNHAYVGLSPGLDFESKLFAKTNAAERLREELSAAGYRPQVLHIGASTDPYQPIERELRITRACLEVMKETKHPVSIITKSSLVERDMDLLAPMAAENLLFVCVTVTTLDRRLARLLEPRCTSPERRIETIRRLVSASIPVAISVSPIIPFVNEPDMEGVLGAARTAGARWASHIPIRLPGEVAPLFEEWLRAHFPDRADRVLARIADMRGGRRNDPRFGTRMRGEGVWAELIARRFALASSKLGLSSERLDLDNSKFKPPRGRQRDLFDA